MTARGAGGSRREQEGAEETVPRPGHAGHTGHTCPRCGQTELPPV